MAEKFERHLRVGQDWEDTFPLRGKDGNYRWFLSRMKVIRDDSGKVERFFGTNTDVTEQRQMAESLREITSELSEADRRKDEFLATLAHELRNPLAPIRNGLEILRLACESRAAVEQTIEETRNMMERQLEQMVRLVDDLLDISRISRGRLELRKERINLAVVLNNAVETSRPIIESGRHELTVNVPPQPVYLDADVSRLGQVFANLLINAAKYSECGRHIRMTVERQGSDVVVSVKDAGVGIPHDMLARIFEMFTHVDQSLERSQRGQSFRRQSSSLAVVLLLRSSSLFPLLSSVHISFVGIRRCKPPRHGKQSSTPLCVEPCSSDFSALVSAWKGLTIAEGTSLTS